MVYREGKSRTSVTRSDGTTIITDKKISKRKIAIIIALLVKAKFGEITEEPYPCDVGTKTLHGYLKQKTIELDVATNCRSHRVNQSRVTPIIAEIAAKICDF